MEIGEIKNDGKIGKLKDDNNYFLGNKVDNFRDKLQKRLWKEIMMNIMWRFFTEKRIKRKD